MWGDKNFANVFRAASTQGKAADVLTAATGGRRESFFSQKATDRVIASIGEELHTQYLLSFKPDSAQAGTGFRPIQVEVQGNGAALRVRTRAGYWSIPPARQP